MRHFELSIYAIYEMSYELRYQEYAEALYQALQEDAFYQTMEASIENNEFAKGAMLKYLDYSMLEGKKYGELYIPSEHKYGVSVWSKPLCAELEALCSSEKKEFLLNQLGENSLNTYTSIVSYMSKKADSLIEPEAWYLSIIGVLPKYQGQGLGPNLVKPVLDLADDLGVSTYLETFTPRNMTFYERLGFTAVEVIFEPTTNAEYTIMARRPPL